MNQKSALSLAAGITAFVLVLIGAVALGISQTGIAPSSASTPEPSPTQIVGIDPTAAQALLDERDAIYRQQLGQANRLLQEANARLQQAYSETPTPTAVPTRQSVPAPLAPSYAVSARQAVAIALSATPDATLMQQPDLVDFQGTPTYEVRLDRGLVYIDANSGKVLFNGAGSQAVAPDSNPASRSTGEREQHQQNENEQGGDD
jgi:uncharacterized membrane protein YkoI